MASNEVKKPDAIASGKPTIRKYSTVVAGGPNQNQFVRPPSTKFEGETKELSEYIFDCVDSKQSDRFAKNLKIIAQYVSKTVKSYGNDIRLSTLNLKPITVPEPSELEIDPPPTFLAKALFEGEVKQYLAQRLALAENIKSLYVIVYGQCTDIMKAKLETLPVYEKLVLSGDGIALLKAIKNQTFNYQGHKYTALALHEAVANFYSFQLPGS
jgi:hypothetical protein